MVLGLLKLISEHFFYQFSDLDRSLFDFGYSQQGVAGVKFGDNLTEKLLFEQEKHLTQTKMGVSTSMTDVDD